MEARSEENLQDEHRTKMRRGSWKRPLPWSNGGDDNDEGEEQEEEEIEEEEEDLNLVFDRYFSSLSCILFSSRLFVSTPPPPLPPLPLAIHNNELT